MLNMHFMNKPSFFKSVFPASLNLTFTAILLRLNEQSKVLTLFWKCTSLQRGTFSEVLIHREARRKETKNLGEKAVLKMTFTAAQEREYP